MELRYESHLMQTVTVNEHFYFQFLTTQRFKL
jgi:hypothetical protein